MDPDSLGTIVAAFKRDPVINIAGLFIIDRDAALMAKIDTFAVTGAFACVELDQPFGFFEKSRAKSR